jgi:hypothetical protein
MPTWKCANPEYLRTVENGSQIFMYRFRILEIPHDILTVARGMTQESLRKALVDGSLADDEYKNYLTHFFQYILETQSRLFIKKYTPEQYVKFIIHNFNNLPIVDGGNDMEHTCTLNPVELILKNGKIYMNWSVELANMIDLQLEESSISAAAAAGETPAVVSDILEVDDVEDGDADDDGNEIMPIRSGHSGSQAMSDKQNRERQRVEEARLRAKLAAVRAERALERYIQKYGDYESETTSGDEMTETDFDSE